MAVANQYILRMGIFCRQNIPLVSRCLQRNQHGILSYQFFGTNEAGPWGFLYSSQQSRKFVTSISEYHGVSLFPERYPLIQHVRTKKKSAKVVEEKEDEDEEDAGEQASVVEDSDDGEIRDWTLKTIYANSLRLDGILKTALSTSRSKIDEGVFDGRIRVNGEKIAKKSIDLAVGDEADYIVGPDPKNNEFLEVSRVVIDEVGTEAVKGKAPIKVKIWKKLVVDNYPGQHKFTIVSK